VGGGQQRIERPNCTRREPSTGQTATCRPAVPGRRRRAVTGRLLPQPDHQAGQAGRGCGSALPTAAGPLRATGAENEALGSCSKAGADPPDGYVRGCRQRQAEHAGWGMVRARPTTCRPEAITARHPAQPAEPSHKGVYRLEAAAQPLGWLIAPPVGPRLRDSSASGGHGNEIIERTAAGKQGCRNPGRGPQHCILSSSPVAGKPDASDGSS